MTTTTFISVNVFLALAALVAVAVIVRLSYRLSETAPLDDERWGTSGNPHVPSEPLPLRQVAEHEDDRAAA